MQDFVSRRSKKPSRPMETTANWQNLISELIASPGVAMVVGATDTGKTRLCLELCMAGLEAGISTAIVDADVGQSEIGAPGTIGMALVDRPVQVLSELKPKRLYFVGATTPADHLLECVIGSKKLVDVAIAQGARLVVLDTTGLVGGWFGRKLKTAKADLVRPDYLIGVQKKREIEHLLMPFAKVAPIKVRCAESSELARRKAPEVRAARRRSNYSKHFAEAQGHMIRLDDVSLWNTWLGTGRPMKWQYMKSVEETVGSPVLHAEVTGRGILLITERPCSTSSRRELETAFKTSSITAVTGDAFSNVLVGLADENANTINVGLLQSIDFKHRSLSVVSPIKTVSPVRVVQFGSVRVTKDGEELGTIRSGDI